MSTPNLLNEALQLAEREGAAADRWMQLALDANSELARARLCLTCWQLAARDLLPQPIVAMVEQRVAELVAQAEGGLAAGAG